LSFVARVSAFLVKGEVEHKVLKQSYARTSRKPGFVAQIASQIRRRRIIKLIREKLERTKRLAQRLRTSEDPIAKDSNSSYTIGKSQNHPIDLHLFLEGAMYDPASTVSLASHRILTHLLITAS
jgi:hypothetical protein